MKTLPLRNRIVFAMAGLLVLCLIPLLAFNLLSRKPDAAEEPAPLIEFEYCGASPAELCILSFGRDGAGNAIINFFVPDKKFPGFYLIVGRAGVQNRYECRKNTEIKTSVFCSGEPLSLKQTIEIDLFARESDQLLATGTFFIEAFLVSTQATQSTTQAGVQTELSPTLDPATTQTITPEVSTASSPPPSTDPVPSTQAAPSAYPYP